MLASLPRVTPQGLQQFSRALLALNGEKAQRDLIKRLLVCAGWWVLVGGCWCCWWV